MTIIGKNYQQIQQLVGQRYDEKQDICRISKCIPIRTRYLVITKVEKFGRHHRNQVKKSTLPVMRWVSSCTSLMAQHHFCDTLAKTAQAQPNHEKASDKPKSENTVGHNLPGLFKVMKGQGHERQRQTEELPQIGEG